MRHVYIIAALIAGMLAALSITNKQEHILTGYVTTDSSEIEAVWYPE